MSCRIQYSGRREQRRFCDGNFPESCLGVSFSGTAV